MNKASFITALLEDQPFVPKYFPYNVELNRIGAPHLLKSLKKISFNKPGKLNRSIFVIDTRPEKEFKNGHLPGSINLQNGGKFETWLGSIIAPDGAFYLVAGSIYDLQELVMRCAKIGYEGFIERAFICNNGPETMERLDIEHFKSDLQSYTIVDIRNPGEVKANPVFKNAINIPLPELRERISEIPFNKPLIVHCAGGYRSAAGSSIIRNAFGTKTTIYDLGEDIKSWM